MAQPAVCQVGRNLAHTGWRQEASGWGPQLPAFPPGPPTCRAAAGCGGQLGGLRDRGTAPQGMALSQHPWEGVLRLRIQPGGSWGAYPCMKAGWPQTVIGSDGHSRCPQSRGFRGSAPSFPVGRRCPEGFQLAGWPWCQVSMSGSLGFPLLIWGPSRHRAPPSLQRSQGPWGTSPLHTSSGAPASP